MICPKCDSDQFGVEDVEERQVGEDSIFIPVSWICPDCDYRVEREPHCCECVNWFLGCLNGREKWGDKAITPNLRHITLKDGSPSMLCDAFLFDPNPYRHGRVVYDGKQDWD